MWLAVGEEEKWTMKLALWLQSIVLPKEADCKIVGYTISGLPILSLVPTQLFVQRTKSRRWSRALDLSLNKMSGSLFPLKRLIC